MYIKNLGESSFLSLCTFSLSTLISHSTDREKWVVSVNMFRLTCICSCSGKHIGMFCTPSSVCNFVISDLFHVKHIIYNWWILSREAFNLHSAQILPCEKKIVYISHGYYYVTFNFQNWWKLSHEVHSFYITREHCHVKYLIYIAHWHCPWNIYITIFCFYYGPQ